jgi:hypothetical protein
MTIFAQRNIIEVKPAGWQVWKIFSGASLRRGGAGIRSEAKDRLVRLLEPTRRAPLTLVESEVISLIKNEGLTSYDRLVQRVADDLYQEELRSGAGALDIGLFGSRLFDRDVVCALKDADGILWKVTGDEDKQ